MWQVKRGGQRNGTRLIVRYSLLTLITFMLVCISLAIILVLYSTTALHDRTQGIILILVLIGLNYTLGLVAVWRTHLLLLSVFGLVDLFLCAVCVLGTHQGHHIGNLGALSVFGASGVLSASLLWQSWSDRTARRAASIQNASVNCYHHVPDDCWYDYGSTSPFTSEKDELIANQLLPYNCNCLDEVLAITPNGAPSTFCTVDTNEQHFLRGDRYAV